MRVCMITPHLPPEQSANALLPVVLADELKRLGVESRLVAHRGAGQAARPADGAIYVPRRGRGWASRTVAGAAWTGARIAHGARHAVAAADIVHLHSNGLIIEVGQWLATRYRKPYVVTLYGTDVWHHDPRRHARFTHVVKGAACRVFYSHALLEFARPLGLAPDPAGVIHAPVAPPFRQLDEPARAQLRRELGLGVGPLLVTVKRLHPVGGHEDLLRAMPALVHDFPSVRLLLVGDGELRPRLTAVCRELGLEARVTFLGRLDNEEVAKYDAAADLFVLSSRLESWGTVMLEALACGTPVVATDTAGGAEVRARFPDSVTLVPRQNPRALAQAISHALQNPSRTSDATRMRLREEFSPRGCASLYLKVYEPYI